MGGGLCCFLADLPSVSSASGGGGIRSRPVRNAGPSVFSVRFPKIQKKMPDAPAGGRASGGRTGISGALRELEEKYQEIIRGLLENGKDLENQMEERYADLVDAYTVWAHQIKTPIAAMRLKLSGEDTNLSREILEEVLRIEQYVEMALVVLRLDGNSTDYVLARYELDSILRQAIHRFSSQFIRKKIRLLYQPVQYSVVTDEKWLLFVVEQILSNALKYTKPGGTITIAMDTPGILAIQDTGIGIAAEDLPRIFDKGYTGYNERKDKKASGLGLYLCRRICENLGHSVRANSDPETGTVILLDLRRKELEAE